MPEALDSISNRRLIRAIQALGQDDGRRNRDEFSDALGDSTLLFEARLDSEGRYQPLSHQMRDGRIEYPVFTDVGAYRLWRPEPIPGHALLASKGGKLLDELMHSREIDGHDLAINPGGPITLRLSCSGAALLLLKRYPVWII